MSLPPLPPVRGRVAYVFAQPDFNADAIIGGFRNLGRPVGELAAIAMEDFDPGFRASIARGDVLVGGRNFGFGHPHYPPMKAMRELGIGGVIAESFSLGYWRGEISMGFPHVQCPGILDAVARWDEIEIDWAAGEVVNRTAGRRLPFLPLSRADHLMLATGGLEPFIEYSARHLQPA